MRQIFESAMSLVTLKSWRLQRRRRRYEEIKALVVQEHLAGKGGLVLPKKYDMTDLKSFRPPMYFHARDPKNQLVLVWRKELMSEEVGPPNSEVKNEVAT